MLVVKKPTTIRAGIKKVIHINGALLRANKKRIAQHKESPVVPCITVQCTDGVFYCGSFEVLGNLVGKQNFHNPRSNGAVVWLETRAALRVHPV